MAEDCRSRITRWIRMVGVVVMLLVAVASSPGNADALLECEDYDITCSTLNACLSVIGNSCGCEGMVMCDTDHTDCAEGSHPVMTYCREDFPE